MGRVQLGISRGWAGAGQVADRRRVEVPTKAGDGPAGPPCRAGQARRHLDLAGSGGPGRAAGPGGAGAWPGRQVPGEGLLGERLLGPRGCRGRVGRCRAKAAGRGAARPGAQGSTGPGGAGVGPGRQALGQGAAGPGATRSGGAGPTGAGPATDPEPSDPEPSEPVAVGRGLPGQGREVGWGRADRCRARRRPGGVRTGGGRPERWPLTWVRASTQPSRPPLGRWAVA